MPRLFTGLQIPDSEVERLADLQGRLPGARWVDPDNFHVTLRFIGDVDGPTADAFVERLAEIEVPVLDLRVLGLASYGHKRPRVLYAAIEANDTLDRLYRAHERAACAIGLEPERRKFSPHVTIARLNGTRPIELAQYLESYGANEGTPFRAKQFVLYSSRSGSGGGPYVLEEVFPLSQAAHKSA